MLRLQRRNGCAGGRSSSSPLDIEASDGSRLLLRCHQTQTFIAGAIAVLRDIERMGVGTGVEIGAGRFRRHRHALRKQGELKRTRYFLNLGE